MLSAGTNVEWLRVRPRHHRHRRRIARGREPVRDHRRRLLRPRPARTRHPPLGLRRPRHAARAHPRHRAGPRSCGPCSRASPTGAPTSSRPPRPTAGVTIPTLRVDGGMSRNPTFVQALADSSQRVSRSRPSSRPPRSAPDCSPASPSGPGATGTTSPRPGSRIEPSSPVNPSTGSVGHGRSNGRRAGTASCRPSTSQAACEPRRRPSSTCHRRPDVLKRGRNRQSSGSDDPFRPTERRRPSPPGGGGRP